MGFNLIEGDVNATQKPDLSFPPAREQILLHDHAGTGFPSWEVLGNGGAAAGVVYFDGQGLRIISPDVSTGSPGGQSFGASALNRFTRPSGVTRGGFSRVYMQFDWKLRPYRSSAGVYSFTKGIELGIDTADYGTAGTPGGGAGGLAPVSANRTLAMVRFCMFDEGNTTYYGGKFQMTAGSASAPSYIDLKDSSGNLISPTTAGYEELAGGMNYGKWLRQRTELVFDLTPQTIPGSAVALSVTNGSKTATYTGTQVPIYGGAVVGTSVAPGTFVDSVNTGTNTVTLSQNASATSTTMAGASFSSAKVIARLEGLRHNGLGFGSFAVGPTGYSRSGPRWDELLLQQNVPTAGGISMPALSQDMGFGGGMNMYAQIDNRSTQPSKATLIVTRARLGVF